MGQYDNYDNRKAIEKAEKKLQKVLKKRNPSRFEEELAERELDTALLFSSCQMFGRTGLQRNDFDPNENILFSDDNKVMLFFGNLIKYKDIQSYRITEKKVQKSYTTSKKKGTFSRAVVGGCLAGPVGAIVGASSASTKSDTHYYESSDGFLLQIFLRDETEYHCSVPACGLFSDKIPKMWLELSYKLEQVIDENKSQQTLRRKRQKQMNNVSQEELEESCTRARHKEFLSFIEACYEDGWSVSKMARFTHRSEEEVLDALDELGLDYDFEEYD